MVYGLISVETPAVECACLQNKIETVISEHSIHQQHIWGPHGPWFSPLEDIHHLLSPVTLNPLFNRELMLMIYSSKLRVLKPKNRYSNERGHWIFQGECMNICSVPGPVLGTVDPAVTKVDITPALLDRQMTIGL